jgi:hypothetical protein
MIFQVIIAVSEFKDKIGNYYHSRVISLTKGVDKEELVGWDYKYFNLPHSPGIWCVTVEKESGKFKIISMNFLFDISLNPISLDNVAKKDSKNFNKGQFIGEHT